MSSTYAVGDEMTLQAIARDAASTDPAQPHLDHYPRPYYPLVGDPPPPDIGTYPGTVHYAPPVPQGWQCPVCKTVYAPSVTMCRCDIPASIPDDFVGLGKPNSVTPVRIRVTDKEAAE